MNELQNEELLPQESGLAADFYSKNHPNFAKGGLYQIADLLYIIQRLTKFVN
jgi:hypothetical protein